MSHLTDDDLVLHYYGEDGSRLVAAERHLQECAQCAGAYEALSRTLRSVTPPAFVDVPGELPALRQVIRDRVRERSIHRRGSDSTPPGEFGAIAIVWLAVLVYPFSFQALFNSARLAQEHTAGLLLVVPSLLWAVAGPLVAVLVLNRVAVNRGDRAVTRLLVAGALMATISPALYAFLSRVIGPMLIAGMPLWYGAIALGALLAFVPWPNKPERSVRFLYVHRLSAVIVIAYVLAHIVNQAVAFVSVPAYTAMRSVMRVASEQPATYTLIVGAVAIQVVTGAAMGLAKVQRGAFARNLTAVSGWYLAAFLLVHVLGSFVPSAPATAATGAVNQLNLLASARGTAQLPYLLLGVAAFLFHVGVYARLAALAYFAEASVRRLSYAGMLAGTTVVVTVGLALCGIHLTR